MRKQQNGARMLLFVSWFLVVSVSWGFQSTPGAAEDLRQRLIQSESEPEQNLYFEVNENTDDVQSINLLDFDRHPQKWPEPEVPYNRDKQFGGWIKDKTRETCLNTRGLVLLRDSESSLTYNSSGCTVLTGLWFDPYSGRTYKSASDLQIDHFVPLKNAYISGAFEWTNQKRCLYSNYIKNDIHLIAVLGSENQKKSDKTPEGYMPPSHQFKCEYLKRWLTVKLIWKLRLTAREKETVENLFEKEKCSNQEFMVDESFISEQKNYIQQTPNYCSP